MLDWLNAPCIEKKMIGKTSTMKIMKTQQLRCWLYLQATSQHLVVPILSTAAPASSAPTTAAGQPGRPTAVPANPRAAQVWGTLGVGNLGQFV